MFELILTFDDWAQPEGEVVRVSPIAQNGQDELHVPARRRTEVPVAWPPCVAEALKRFATGTYAVWYPIIPRPEAHDLPRKLKTLATKAGKPWLHATLTVKSSKLTSDAAGETKRPGLPASGMFVINPPYTLPKVLEEVLPWLESTLALGNTAGHRLDHQIL